LIYYSVDTGVGVPTQDNPFGHSNDQPDQISMVIVRSGITFENGAKLLRARLPYGDFGILNTEREHQKIQSTLSTLYPDAWKMRDWSGKQL
jgi:hypothetical protein